MKKNRRAQNLFHGFLLCSLLALLLQPIFVSAGTSEAVTYLKNQTPDAWSTMALAAAGQTDLSLDHLRSVSGTVATDYAKTILALTAANQDPATFGSIDYVAKLKSFHANNQMGDANLLNDDIWSVLALASDNQGQSPEATDAKNYIISHQNSDGGWGYGLTTASDSNDTAAAIMALLETGIGATNESITKAVAYLKIVQNDDGGFGYAAGASSDSGSDAWVISAISKLGQDPASWSKNNVMPLDHLLSLQDTDGGFWWMTPGTTGNNKAMTAFAVIALAGKSYPVGHYISGTANPGSFHVRIEGKTKTICDTSVVAANALDIIKQAATACNFTYTISSSSFGQYLSAINDEPAAGMSGWLYFVNNKSPEVGAADYVLHTGDEVLWYYGEWGWNPTRLALDKTTANVNETIHATAQYYNGFDWLPLPNAVIAVNDTTKTTDATGALDLSFDTAGAYTLFINSPAFVRSSSVTLTVGAATVSRVGLQAEVEQGTIDGSSIMLVVSPDNFNFGKIHPGQKNDRQLTLDNQGSGLVTVHATVTGDPLFADNLSVDSSPWSSYSRTIGSQTSAQANVALTVPLSFTGAGVKNGELIIWANAQ